MKKLRHTSRRLDHVLIDHEGRLVGILSERDLVRVIAQYGGTAIGMQVGEMMTRSVITCTVDTSVEDVLDFCEFSDRRIGGQGDQLVTLHVQNLLNLHDAESLR